MLNLRPREEHGVIEIAVLELHARGTENAYMPVEYPEEMIGNVTKHAMSTIEKYRALLPNAKIYLLPATTEGMQWLLDKKNPVAIVNLSASSTYDPGMEHKLAERSFLITSAGNQGEKGETWSARQEFWCSVGAIGQDNEIKSYSSRKYGAVDTVTYVDYLLPGTQFIADGTSDAAPIFGGLLGQWFVWFKREFGIYPTTKHVYQFIKENSHDIWDDDDNIEYGHGLFRLPHKFKHTAVLIDPRSDIDKAVAYEHIEGQSPIFKGQVDLLSDPEIINDRTYVPANGLCTFLGNTVMWDGVHAWFTS